METNEVKANWVIKHRKVILIVSLVLMSVGSLVALFLAITTKIFQNGFLYFVVFCLPFCLLALIFGIIYTKKSKRRLKILPIINIGISSFIILYGGILSLVLGVNEDTYEYDYSYVEKIGDVIGYEFPATGTVESLYYYKYDPDYEVSDIYYTDYPYKISSTVKFTEKNEVVSFLGMITTDSNWLKTVPTILKSIISYSSYYNKTNQLYLLYNKSTSEYNTFPEAAGKYRMIFLTYDVDEATLKIVEYDIEVIY